ncbi:hypothetical protein ZOSMA_176G00400 [Zostera marina]|uniref:GATA-type domain-containing protein n=1 Tax=Zostera marina TaxID=29655 RepID=A0A0K9PS08_ZOSMR|nr:hypothetical protein ZOSMA_176G00400 [Zostera marina]
MMLARGWGAQHNRGSSGGSDIRRRMMTLLGVDLFKCSRKKRRRRRSRLELESGMRVKLSMDDGTGEVDVDVVELELEGSGSTADGIDVGDCIKVCVDCQTTKTPLWRTGPIGPKTLCNACGIRYMKLRRKGLVQNNMMKSKSGSKVGVNLSKSSPTSTSMSANEVEMLKRKQKKKQEVIWSLLQQSRKFASTCGKEEAEAAVLLMALSTGLFLHSSSPNV